MTAPTLVLLEKLRTIPGPEVQQHGITWQWCDALFMGSPVLAKAAAIDKQPRLLVLNDMLYA